MSGAGAVKAKRQPQKKDRTTTFILIAIAALLVLSLVLVVFSDSGVKERSIVVVSSDNYEVTATMLAYYESTAYSSLFSQYYNLYYTYYFSGDANSAYAMAQQSMSQYTLDDFFDSALASAKELLVLCEAAKNANVSLDENDFAEIDEAIDSIDGNYTSNFGTGVKEKDVRKAMELRSLASKYYTTFVKEKLDSVTADEIAKYIEEHKADFYAAHLLKYAITLEAKDYSEDEAAFEAAKALADACITKLEAATTPDEFRTAIVEYIVARDFASTVDSKVSEDLVPDEASLAIHQQRILENLIFVLVEGKEESEIIYEAGSVEEAMSKVADALESTCATALSSLETAQKYVEETEDETVQWIISADTAVNATKSTDTSDDAKYTRTVYMVTETLHLEDEETVNVGHILIEARKATAKEEDLANAKKKAEDLLATFLAGEKTKDAFEALAKENTADSGVFYDNVAEGDMVAEFNDWIFSEDRKEVGETGIVKTDYGYHVMYWNGKGETTSNTSAKDGIVSDFYNAFLEEEQKSLTLNEKYIAKHTAETESETTAA